jgi:ABC-type phosphate/phosphonate transport system substrate-binding protein
MEGHTASWSVGREPLKEFAMRRLPIPVVLAVVFTLVMSASVSTALADGQQTDVGTFDNPVKLSVNNPYGDLGPQQILADALHAATGLEFIVQAPVDGEEAVEWMCGEFSDSMTRVAGGAEYVFADELCGADTRLQLVINGTDRYQGEFLVPSDSDLYTLDDLAGLDWYYPDESSLSGYVAPLGMLVMAGVEGYTGIEAGNHLAAVQAVYDNAVSTDSPAPVFATAFVDARVMIEDAYPDVYDEVRVLAKSPAIPNSPVVFGPDFPANLRRQIEKALVALSDPDGPNYAIWQDSIEALTSATGLDKAKMKEFDFLRAALEAAEIGIGDL